VREHFEEAVRLAPADATSRHLLGLWFYEAAGLVAGDAVSSTEKNRTNNHA